MAESFNDFEDRDWFESFTDPINRLLVGGAFPPINISVTQDKFIIQAELPGVDKSDLDIQVAERSITIRGRRSLAYPEQALIFHKEREGGEFNRTVGLPRAVDTTKADASFTNGILLISFPRKAASHPKQIKVESGE